MWSLYFWWLLRTGCTNAFQGEFRCGGLSLDDVLRCHSCNWYTKAHSICTCANIAHQQFSHSITEHISLEELQLTWAKPTHTAWGLSSNELVTSDNLKTHHTYMERLWGVLACSWQATSPQGTRVGMRKWQSRRPWEDYPTFPSAPWTALAKQESPATYSERSENGLSPSDES